jgi:large subunit ribosomal protein L5
MADEKDKKKGAKPSEAEIAARKAAAKAKKSLADMSGDDDAPQGPPPPARLATHYRERIVPALKQQFGYTNALAVPRLKKIVISMGLGKAMTGGEKAKMDIAEKDLAVISGQKPVRCRAKKSVANFKVREGMETGLKVTLRGARMFEFLDRLITLAMPRVKDFRGMSPNGFDGAGNYNFGFSEQSVFPEVDTASMTFQQGMNITVVTTARSPKEGRELLRQFGFPFKTDEKEKN